MGEGILVTQKTSLFVNCVGRQGTWHNRLGHPSNSVLSLVLPHCNENVTSNKRSFCESCCLGKHHKLPLFVSTQTCSNPLELIHSDLRGPSPITSTNGYQHYITFIDTYSRYTWLYFLKKKSGAFNAFLNFKNIVEKQFQRSILAFQTKWWRRISSYFSVSCTKWYNSLSQFPTCSTAKRVRFG